MGVYLYSKLPSEYQEVEYVQSSGTQYINTGQSFDCQNTIVEMKFQMPDVSYSSLSSRPRFYGISNGTNEYSLQANRNSITSVTANSYLNNSTYQISATVSKGVDHVSKHYASGVWYVDGVSKGSKSHGDYSTGDNPIFIFEMDSGGQATDRKMILRLYRFKIYNGNTLQRDFIPCYRKSDSVIGLYDLVNSQFYTNSGTGTFSKGADVTAIPLKNAYIGEYHEYTFDFQNEGDLGWTGFTKRGTPSYVSGQGWTIGANSNNSYESGITPPSSIYKGTLREVKIWFSKNSVQTSSKGQGAGICNSDLSIYCHYSHPRSAGPAILYANGSEYYTNATNISGEIYISYIFNDDNSMLVDTNGITYNIGNYASVFRGLWTNKNLCLDICRWGTAAPYIRKVEITTA